MMDTVRAPDSADTVLLGPLTLDRYIDEGLQLPGGGALNIACHWSRLGFPFSVISRVGSDAPGLFTGFLRKHGIRHDERGLVAPGVSASIDIVISDDRQPVMGNYIEGVWSDLQLTAAEDRAIASAGRLHAVLVDPVAREVQRLGESGLLDAVYASGDFMDFRSYDAARFEAVMGCLDLGFVGWPGAVEDPMIAAIRAVAFKQGKLVVVTLGSRGVLVFDGKEDSERFVSVRAVPVRGTTIGCGDAFIAAFLAARYGGLSTLEAVEKGKAQGTAATAWLRALPDSAFEA